MEPHQSHTTAEKTWVDPWPEHPTEATPVGPIRALQPSLNKPSWTNCHEPSSMEHTVNSPEPLQKLRLLGGSRPNCYVIIPCAELASEPCRVLPKFIRRASTKCPAPSPRPTIPRSLISTLPRPILTLPAPSPSRAPLEPLARAVSHCRHNPHSSHPDMPWPETLRACPESHSPLKHL
jgi:hypothetical protein